MTWQLSRPKSQLSVIIQNLTKHTTRKWSSLRIKQVWKTAKTARLASSIGVDYKEAKSLVCFLLVCACMRMWVYLMYDCEGMHRHGIVRTKKEEKNPCQRYICWQLTRDSQIRLKCVNYLGQNSIEIWITDSFTNKQTVGRVQNGIKH